MQGIGAQWHNIHKPATADDDFSIIDVILMMLADTGIMILVTWYLENVKPGQFGMPKPFCFCFMVSWGDHANHGPIYRSMMQTLRFLHNSELLVRRGRNSISGLNP